MSDIDNRQAYVFLQDGDVLDGNDEWYADWGEWIEHSFVQVHYSKNLHGLIRRPIPRTSQSDSQTIEQRVTALELRLNLRTTCGWRPVENSPYIIFNPHNGSYLHISKSDVPCPTCGLRIEVVE